MLRLFDQKTSDSVGVLAQLEPVPAGVEAMMEPGKSSSYCRTPASIYSKPVRFLLTNPAVREFVFRLEQYARLPGIS